MRAIVAAVGVLMAFVSTSVLAYPQQPENPVVGVITHPLNQCWGIPVGQNVTDCVESYFPRWLEDAGVRAVAIPSNASFEEQSWWLQRVNGVLFQGGMLGGQQEVEYIAMVRKILDYAIDRNKLGDRFVVWGTCQGFQVLAAAAAGTMDVIEGPYPGMFPLMMAVNFTLAQPTSRMMGDARCPSDVREWMLTKNTTLNFHEMIIKPSSFSKYPTLGETFTPLTTNWVPNGAAEFVSAYECPFAEVYATQFHPERVLFDFNWDKIGHNAEDVQVAQYFANFVASRLKLNNHTFDTPEQWEANRLSRWPLIDQGYGKRTYYISNGGKPVQ